MLEFPTNKTILVLASYRTGSTALCNLISKKTGLLNCDELFHPEYDPKLYEQYQNQNIVVKIMPDQVPTLYWKELIKKSFVIGISRLPIQEQIASFYLAHRTKHWHFKKSNNNEHDYTIDIERFDLEDQIRYILKMNDIYQQQFVPHVTMEIKYETIKSELDESDYVTYIKPVNYKELLTTIDTLLPEILSWNLTND